MGERARALGTQTRRHRGRTPAPSARVDSDGVHGAHVILVSRRRGRRVFTAWSTRRSTRRPQGAVRPSDRVSTPAPGTPRRSPPAHGSLCSGLGPRFPSVSWGQGVVLWHVCGFDFSS